MLSQKRPKLIDAPVPTKPTLPAQDYRLAGDRRLAEGWKGRAEDNLAAIRLMAAIEAEGRHARPDEQERLAKFTAFGAVDLADKLFRRAGEGFAPAWEDLGLELEQLVSREDLASLSRATQYAHFTPEFMSAPSGGRCAGWDSTAAVFSSQGAARASSSPSRRKHSPASSR